MFYNKEKYKMAYKKIPPKFDRSNMAWKIRDLKAGRAVPLVKLCNWCHKKRVKHHHYLCDTCHFKKFGYK